MSEEYTHGVKVRKTGAKRWTFLSRGGHTNHLLVHALRMSEEQAKTIADRLPQDNPGHEAKVVKF